MFSRKFIKRKNPLISAEKTRGKREVIFPVNITERGAKTEKGAVLRSSAVQI
jgi:hypothetical protein